MMVLELPFNDNLEKRYFVVSKADGSNEISC